MADKPMNGSNPSRMSRRRLLVLASAVAVSSIVALVAWHHSQQQAKAAQALARLDRTMYTPHGLGGYVTPAAPKKATSDPVQPIFKAYNAGRYGDVVAVAHKVIESVQAAKPKAAVNPVMLRQAADARWILAYAYARQHDLKNARTQFALLEQEASRLPDKGKEKVEPGQPAPTLEDEAAFEHAVCTSALGDKPGAEREYVSFIGRFPDSPYIYAALKRIQRMHNGTAPEEADRVFEKAKKIALADHQEIQREHSLCAPECLAELLRRNGKPVDVERLARQMHTSYRGTTLADLADCATHYGYSPRGLALTPSGLARQKLPVIALIQPQHYVLVDALAGRQLTIWDPDGSGLGHGRTLTVPMTRWVRFWGGTTLTL